jgi:hypothetical protein
MGRAPGQALKSSRQQLYSLEDLSDCNIVSVKLKLTESDAWGQLNDRYIASVHSNAHRTLSWLQVFLA